MVFTAARCADEERGGTAHATLPSGGRKQRPSLPSFPYPPFSVSPAWVADGWLKLPPPPDRLLVRPSLGTIAYVAVR